jgi:polar amino acid transport system substrate-binding protein
MKNPTQMILYYACIAIVLSGFQNTYAIEKTIMLASTEYPPYYGYNLKNHGFISEIIKEAYNAAGYKIIVDYMTWKRALNDTKEGKYDGLFTVWHRKDREQWFVFTDPLPPNEIGFYKLKKNKITFKTYNDLKSYDIGIIQGYSYPSEFTQAGLRLEGVPQEHHNIAKLILGRMDLIVTDKILGKYIMATMHPESIDAVEWLEPPIEVTNQYLVISKKTQDYQSKVEAYNLGLRTITKKGFIKKIMAKHGF